MREGLGIIEGGARSSREEDREDIMPFQAGTSPPSLVLPLTPLISPSWPGWSSISGGPKQYTPSSTPSLRAHPALLTICPLPPLLATDWTSISGPKQCTPSSTHSTTCRTAASSCRRASFSPQPPPPPLLNISPSLLPSLLLPSLLPSCESCDRTAATQALGTDMRMKSAVLSTFVFIIRVYTQRR